MTAEQHQAELDQRFVDQKNAFEARINSLQAQLAEERESARKIQQTLEMQLSETTASKTAMIEQLQNQLRMQTDRIAQHRNVWAESNDGRQRI